MAEGLLQRELRNAGVDDLIEVDSAGTQTTQSGRRPDKRGERAAAIAGIDLTKMRSRRVRTADLVNSDLVLAMDNSNVRDLKRICPEDHRYKISLLLSLAPQQQLREVPDPYYGSTEGFETVFELLQSATSEAAADIIDHVL